MVKNGKNRGHVKAKKNMFESHGNFGIVTLGLLISFMVGVMGMV